MRGRPRHDDILTPREWQVLDLVRAGLTNEEIGVRLGISFGAAKFHVGEILSKLGASSRQEAAQMPVSERRRSVLPFPFSILWPGRELALVAGLVVLSIGGAILLMGVSDNSAWSRELPSALGVDEGHSSRDSNTSSAISTPRFEHTILVSQDSPANTGDASSTIAALRRVESFSELSAVLTPDIHVVVVDQSVTSQLTGTDFLYRQILMGRAVLELNTCLDQVHYLGNAFSLGATPQVITEFPPESAVTESSDILSRCSSLPSYADKGVPFFGFRRATTLEETAGPEQPSVDDNIAQLRSDLFLVILTILNEDPAATPEEQGCKTATDLDLMEAKAVFC